MPLLLAILPTFVTIQLNAMKEVLMKKSLILFSLLIALLSVACQNEYAGATDCSDYDKNNQILKFMHSWYYWEDKLDDSITYTTYDNPYDLMKALRYKEGENQIDHFSYVTKKQTHDDYYSGKYYGLGYGQKYDTEKIYYVSMVYPDSPAGLAGLKRGMEIIKVNDSTPAELNENKAWNDAHKDDDDFKKKVDWTTVYGDNEEGVEVTLTVREGEGEPKELAMQKSEVHIKSVLASKIIKAGNKKVGYVAFKAFISPSPGELDEAFAPFYEEELEWLIIDMRYNGGGLLSVAEHLASLIAGRELSSKDFIKLEYNMMHSDKNSYYTFSSLKHSLSATKIAFITTRGTASASESVISGLKPYVQDLAIIGGTTYGKPVGMNPTEVCDLMVVPITFKVVNADRWGDYYHGMEPDCAAADDFTHDFGDPLEASIAEALHWLEHDKCSPATMETRSQIPVQAIDEPNSELPGFYKIMGTI